MLDHLATSSLAYIDPITGVIVLQILLAGAVGTITFFRRSLARLFFWKRRPAETDETPPAPPEEG